MARSQRAGSFTVAMALLLGGCASQPPAANRLRTFHDMAEFDAYRERVRTLARSQNVLGSQRLPRPNMRVLLAQNDEQPCDPAIAECGRDLNEVVMTGSRTRTRQSITNNQELDVDEGDIVKQYGRFLIVLQDGRLFSIDTASPGASLRLADRIDVYSSPQDETWFDELLIHGNQLIVTGYNYGEDASEIDLIAIDAAGGLELRARYYIESNDYYSGYNYASRLAHGQFVVYTPIDIDIAGNQPLEIPRIRSWTPGGGLSDWRPLFDITDVYRPIQQTLTPSLHVVSVCRVDRPEKFQCRSRGVVGSAYSEMYVAPDNVYLWLSSDMNDWAYSQAWPDECAKDVDPHSLRPLPAAVFQIPIAGGGMRALHTIGVPRDQFAFDERDGRLLALLTREAVGCFFREPVPLIYESIPLDLFRSAPTTLRSEAAMPLPSVPGWGMQNRYASDYLVYGKPQGYWEDLDTPTPRQLVVVPLASPASYQVLYLSHTVERIELIGDNAVAFGSAEPAETEEDLSVAYLGVSTVELRTQPHLADTKVLRDVRESEGRSHAFNALIADDGSGILGLPTVYSSKAERDWYTPSDVQFFAADAALTLAPLGELAGTNDTDETYECEVSCYDWYGNARPIFIDGRVFALSGSELIEGEIRAGGIVETGRLRMTAGSDPRPGLQSALSSRIRIRDRVEPVVPPAPPAPATDDPIEIIWPVR